MLLQKLEYHKYIYDKTPNPAIYLRFSSCSGNAVDENFTAN